MVIEQKEQFAFLNKEQKEFKMRAMPRVLGTDGKIREFDPKRIIDSVLRETSASRSIAVQTAKDVCKWLLKSDSDIVLAPSIREYVCGILMTYNPIYRKQYTRIGGPFYDFMVKWGGKLSEIKRWHRLDVEDIQKLIERNGLTETDLYEIALQNIREFIGVRNDIKSFKGSEKYKKRLSDRSERETDDGSFSVFPNAVVNSYGKAEPFELDHIVRRLNLQTGIDEDVARDIADRLVIKLFDEEKDVVQSDHIRDLVCAELAMMGFDKEKTLFGAVSSRFHLDDEFLDQFKGKHPDWGPIGYITYKRTYSRLKENGEKEEFWETLRRVVEGVYSAQKTHCKQHGLPWDEQKARRSAQTMYRKIWNFKFTPPGRGLWIMGTDHVYRHGSMALNNCGFISTEEIDREPTKPFRFMMDALMLGVGVGFDTEGAGKVVVQEPAEGTFTYSVPDSREGWVEGLKLLLEAYFKGKKKPTYDYSKVRPKGEPIKGFGGVASGPAPLDNMYKSISDLLEKRINDTLSSVDIVDIMNFIGKCVVAGNVRRSAEIALGDPDDKGYIEMKDRDKYEFECMDRRWASNNSVIVDPDAGFDYSEIAERIKRDGEPGIVWLKNSRRYSRIDGEPDWKDRKVKGVNPCFSGDTLIAVADGRGAVPIKQLAEEGKDIPVYSLDEDGKVVIKMGRHPRITGYDKKLLKITFENGDTLSVTPDHKMLLLNGKVVKAKNLKKGDNLPRFIKRVEGIRDKDYLRVYRDTRDAQKDKIYEHRMIGEFFHPEQWNELYEDGVTHGFVKTNNIVVHHKDENTLNNNPDNLEIMTFSEHSDLHGFYDVEGENNPMYGKSHSEETRKLIGKKTKERCKDEKYVEKLSSAISDGMNNSDVKQKLSEARKNELKKYYLQFERETDLDTVWIDDQLFVKKYCESCGEEMILPVRTREQSFCSISCANKKEESIQSRKEGQKKYFEERQRDVLHQQINAYKDLIQKLERTPLKKEWETECKKRGVSYRCNSRSDNPHVLKNYGDLKSRAKTYNHRILKIETLPSKENVYNITVDDHHTVGIVTEFDSDTMACDGIFTKQCGEQSLESAELCCLVETFPARHDSYEEFQETLKYAYLYAKSVTLMRTHWKEINAVMLKNRRIGVSMSGIIDAFVRHGRRQLLQWSDKGYGYLKDLDQTYSDWLTVPKSIKITTVKPSGTVSLLPGVSPGIHYPHSEYYIRRIRIAKNSELIPILKEAGYPMERSKTGEKTMMVVEFPIHRENFEKGKRDVSMWQQLQNATDIQKYWSDNQVSITVSFKSEEADQLVGALESYEDKLKSVSFLPLNDHGYKQAPYEEITKEKYEEMVSEIKPTDFNGYTERAEGEVHCDASGGHCDVGY